MIEILLDIELERCLKNCLGKKINDNDIYADDSELKEHVKKLHEDYDHLFTEENLNKYSDEELNSIFEKYSNDLEHVTNEYLNYIRNAAQIIK